MEKKLKIAAVLLAGGRGSRMNSKVQKQYMLLAGKPLLYYSLKAFEESSVDEVVLVVGKGEVSYCQSEIIEPYGFSKVSKIVEGGQERYHSVYEGLKAVESDIVFIHDGARPFLNQALIKKGIDSVLQYHACVLGVLSKDTVKLADNQGYGEFTPERSLVWNIQTPQIFDYVLIKEAYDKLFVNLENQVGVTDDTMVLERMLGQKVKLIEGDYRNIKITSPEDMVIAEAILKLISDC